MTESPARRARRPLTRTRLAPLARAALGPARTLTGVRRLRGGSRKGVYRLTLDDHSTAVAYVWSPGEDYWDQPDPDSRDPFSPGTGLELFTAAHERLAASGVRTPRLLHTDASHTHLPADTAVVEDLTGGSLEDALARDPRRAPEALERFADLLTALHARTGPRFGKVAVVDRGGSSLGGSCARRVTEDALRHLAEAAARDPRAAAVRGELEETVLALAAEVRPRDRHTLLHGELGPDHVLLTAGGQPALIDIEGLMYGDLEQEHVFLALRFGEHYEALRVPGLDAARLRLYRLAMHLGLVAGPLALAEGDFPHPERMREIAEHNLRQALTLLRSAS
ncbi:aminoglycoside phosphotransferase family protein [Streptomyces sp. NPDC006624]|uniref:aminoglycoside phosphotransferase family protein n=1 Tax=Streptomyces sp. NPDC006624 TaxID=3154892 RepID=UPI0033B491D5